MGGGGGGGGGGGREQNVGSNGKLGNMQLSKLSSNKEQFGFYANH